ncbi:hypothetical protein GHT06_007633 [Daphnia sinensis]|uniref:Innexin n=1 Tax=Daphnia sinensis TaxID=1820382 RepID=A0AAD5KFF4_9CRUS|nr:hypothetical protein GHT06_007633 [Daphnia sinensis]
MSFLFHFGDLLLDGKDPVDDSVDKIHRRCTIVFLLLLSLPLFTKQFAGEPIECFTPTYFTEAQSRYVNSYCWTVSTFYLDQGQQQSQQLQPPSMSDNSEAKRTAYDTDRGDGRVHSVDYVDEYEIPLTMQQGGQRVQVKVNYYQWAPMILLGKAITFYVPFAIWKSLARRRGISLRQLMKRITRLSEISPSHPDRCNLLHEILEQFHFLVSATNRQSGAGNKVQRTPSHPVRLTMQQSQLFITFLFIKILYLLNVLLQFYLLVTFLGDDYLTHGWEIVRHLWTKRTWWTSPRFPLQTLCSVRAAQQGSLRLYQCHCVLPINLFNEKICSIWWFYIVALLPLTITSLAVWCYRNCLVSVRAEFVEHYLLPNMNNDEDDDNQRRDCRSFTIDYLGCDGVFVLRLIEINHGSTTLRTIVQELCKRRKAIQHLVRTPEPGNPALVPTVAVAIPQLQTYTPMSSRLTQGQPKIHPSSPGAQPLSRRLSSITSRPAPFQRMRSRLSLQGHSVPSMSIA